MLNEDVKVGYRRRAAVSARTGLARFAPVPELMKSDNSIGSRSSLFSIPFSSAVYDSKES